MPSTLWTRVNQRHHHCHRKCWSIYSRTLLFCHFIILYTSDVISFWESNWFHISHGFSLRTELKLEGREISASTSTFVYFAMSNKTLRPGKNSIIRFLAFTRDVKRKTTARSTGEGSPFFRALCLEQVAEVNIIPVFCRRRLLCFVSFVIEKTIFTNCFERNGCGYISREFLEIKEEPKVKESQKIKLDIFETFCY